MESATLKTLFVDELKDLYNSENQLIKALPKLAKASHSAELRSGFEEHLEQTKEHAARLERILGDLDESPKGKKCKGIEGIIKEGGEIMDEDFEPNLMDAAIISAAQRAEHYEIAAYGTVRTWASLLGQEEAASLLEQTLEEEKETDQKLTEMAENINAGAREGSEIEESARLPRSRSKSAGA